MIFYNLVKFEAFWTSFVDFTKNLPLYKKKHKAAPSQANMTTLNAQKITKNKDLIQILTKV